MTATTPTNEQTAAAIKYAIDAHMQPHLEVLARVLDRIECVEIATKALQR